MREPTDKYLFILLDPISFPLIFFSIVVLLILAFDHLARVVVFAIQSAYLLDGAIHELYKAHLEFELPGLLDLLVHEVYLLVQELYLLG